MRAVSAVPGGSTASWRPPATTAAPPAPAWPRDADRRPCLPPPLARDDELLRPAKPPDLLQAAAAGGGRIAVPCKINRFGKRIGALSRPGEAQAWKRDAEPRARPLRLCHLRARRADTGILIWRRAPAAASRRGRRQPCTSRVDAGASARSLDARRSHCAAEKMRFSVRAHDRRIARKSRGLMNVWRWRPRRSTAADPALTRAGPVPTRGRGSLGGRRRRSGRAVATKALWAGCGVLRSGGRRLTWRALARAAWRLRSDAPRSLAARLRSLATSRLRDGQVDFFAGSVTTAPVSCTGALRDRSGDRGAAWLA